MLLACCLAAGISHAAPLTEGNLLVLRAGNSANPFIVGNYHRGRVLEVTPAGTIVQEFPLPGNFTIRQGSNINFYARRLIISGHTSPVGEDVAASNSTDPFTGYPKAVGTLDLNGDFGAHHRIANIFSNGSTYDAVVVGDKVWMGGVDSLVPGLYMIDMTGMATRVYDSVTRSLTMDSNGELWGAVQNVGYGIIRNTINPGPPETVGAFIQLKASATVTDNASSMTHEGNLAYSARPTGADGIRRYSNPGTGFVHSFNLGAGQFTPIDVDSQGSSVAAVDNSGRVWVGTDSGVATPMNLILTNPVDTRYVAVAFISQDLGTGKNLSGNVNVGNDYAGTTYGWDTVPVTFNVWKNDQLRQSCTLNLTPVNGVASYSLPLPSSVNGDISVEVTAPTWLKTRRGATVNGVQNFVLRNGDCTKDGVVDLSDYTEIALSFNGLYGTSAYRLNADLDKNGVIDLSDYTIMATNFNAIGD